MSNAVQTVGVTLPAYRATWTQVPNFVLSPTDSLRVRASGIVKYGGGATDCSLPEGHYRNDDSPCASDHIDSPGSVMLYGESYNGDTMPPSTQCIANDIVPLALAVCLRDVGVTPPTTANSVADALAPGRDTTYDLITAGGTKAVWFLFNDIEGGFGDNSGQFSCIFDRINDDTPPPNINYGPPVGGRTVPERLFAHLQGQAQSVCWCWAIKPVNGAWEAYTSLDVPVWCPAYTSPNGLNPIPSMRYLSRRGVDTTTVLTALKMENKTVDVTVLNFDRDKLKVGYYDSAEIELFEVNYKSNTADRCIAFAGQLGNAQVGQVSATIELIGWEDYLDKPVGDTYTALCRHQFCGPGCRVDSINSGPVASDWTRVGTVLSVNTDMSLTVRVSGSAGGANFMPRLAEGLLMFTGGANDGASVTVKAGQSLNSTDAALTLHQACPILPSVGDAITLRTGCKKDATACKGYSNFVNFGAFPYIPLKEGVMRRG